MERKLDDEIIITSDDILTMLDGILEKRDHEWWDKFYSDREKPIPFFKNIPDECLISYCTSNILNKGKALDIGCGNGRNSVYLAKQGFDVVGIDISDEVIKWAQESSADKSSESAMAIDAANKTRSLPGEHCFIRFTTLSMICGEFANGQRVA
ncbi:MAG TPA: methyltransferase domain-containing protein [Syntrophomonas sp.]|nr:methyltransferase domain-containing protein [Syntrophomonas sp.]